MTVYAPKITVEQQHTQQTCDDVITLALFLVLGINLKNTYLFKVFIYNILLVTLSFYL